MAQNKLLALPAFQVKSGNDTVQTISSSQFPCTETLQAKPATWAGKLLGSGSVRDYPMVYTEATHKASWGIEPDDDPASPANIEETSPFAPGDTRSRTSCIEYFLRYRAPQKPWGTPNTVVRHPRAAIMDRQDLFDQLIQDAEVTDLLDKRDILLAVPNIQGLQSGGVFMQLGMPASGLQAVSANTTIAQMATIDEMQWIGGELLVYSYSRGPLPTGLNVFPGKLGGFTRFPKSTVLSYATLVDTVISVIGTFGPPFAPPPLPPPAGISDDCYQFLRSPAWTFAMPNPTEWYDSGIKTFHNDEVYTYDLQVAKKCFPRFARYKHVHYVYDVAIPFVTAQVETYADLTQGH